MVKHRPGWVYILTNEGMPGIIKVGHSRLDAAKRCAEINSAGCHLTPFVLAWSVKVSDCLRVELGAHRVLEDWRLRHDRELFATSVDAGISAIESAGHDLRHFGRLRSPPRESCPKLSYNDRRLRIPALYEWLKVNHDDLALRISESGYSGIGNEYTGAPVYEEIRDEWIASLPRDHPRRRCTPLGLFMEWERVHQEVMFHRKTNRMHLVERIGDQARE